MTDRQLIQLAHVEAGVEIYIHSTHLHVLQYDICCGISYKVIKM